MRFFTKTHEWVKVENNTATVGITLYAQEQLGDVVYIELPERESELKQHRRLGTIESTKAASEIYSPLSGRVIEVNQELADKPQLVNDDPLGKGWMVKLEISDKSELDSLLSESTYNQIVDEESR